MENETYYPSFNPADLPACTEHAARALRLAREAVATLGKGPQLEAARKELAYAEAQAARFPEGTALQPARNAAQRRYSELMEGIGEGSHGWRFRA